MKKDDYITQKEHAFNLVKNTLEQCGVELRYEDCMGAGGLTRIKEKKIVFINKTLGIHDKITVCIDALRRMDTGNIFIPPQVRCLMGEEEWNESD
ncbi:MAG: hypothetical protein GF401_11290 [Chitinivibrionales bacterium]|nr:hypothetical protein [Chitinivibrionales bacterium]